MVKKYEKMHFRLVFQFVMHGHDGASKTNCKNDTTCRNGPLLIDNGCYVLYYIYVLII